MKYLNVIEMQINLGIFSIMRISYVFNQNIFICFL